METWTVSQYMERMERACLDIQERRTPVERTITLWWGLDGLRLAEDGSMEWFSRRQERPGPVQYSPPALIRPPTFPTYEDFVCGMGRGTFPCGVLHSDHHPILFAGGQSGMANLYAMGDLLARNMAAQTQSTGDHLRALDQRCCNFKSTN